MTNSSTPETLSVPAFIARVQELVATVEGIALMNAVGIPNGLALVCATVQAEIGLPISETEKKEISMALSHWILNILNGKECFCGKCAGKNGDVLPEAHQSLN